MSIVEREQTTLPDFETWPTVEETPETPEIGTIAFEAERLDRLFPGWADRIDISTLDLNSPVYCVLGQGAYITKKRFFGFLGREKYLGFGPGHNIVDDDANEHGNFVATGAYASRWREAEWIVEIERRRTR